MLCEGLWGKPISIWIMEVDTNRAVIRKLFWQQHFVTEHRETRVIKLAIKGVDLWVLERNLVQGLFMIIAHQNVFLHFYCWQITCKPTRELMIFPLRPCNFVLVYIYIHFCHQLSCHFWFRLTIMISKFQITASGVKGLTALWLQLTKSTGQWFQGGMVVPGQVFPGSLERC